MCLKLPFIEAMQWKRRAHDLYERASNAKIDPDPLLTLAPELSRVVSIVEGLKKRHGTLIEDALIEAIKLVPGWDASHKEIPRGRSRGVFKTDCVALDQANNTAYVFECKRNYKNQDADKIRAINDRLDEIGKLFPQFAASKGWMVAKQEFFILSFYGGGSGNSRYTVHDRHSVATLFPPCAMRVVEDLISYSETVVGQWCSRWIDQHPSDAIEDGQLKEAPVRLKDNVFEGNLFELLDRETFPETATFEIGAKGIRVIGVGGSRTW